MQRFLVPAQLGLGAVRHLAWYVSHQVNGAAAKQPAPLTSR
jgi:hypothetical protein